MTTNIIDESLSVVNRLISQNRHNDALPLLESCMATIRDLQQQQQDDRSTSLLEKYHDDVTMKYASCLVRLQRYEAALYTIESSCSAASCATVAKNNNNSKNNNKNGNQKNDNFQQPSSLFNSNSNFVTAAVVAGVVDPAPPRFLTENGPESIVKQEKKTRNNNNTTMNDDAANNNNINDDDDDDDDTSTSNGGYLTKDALEIALESSLALSDWHRAKLYATALLYLDASSVTALLALGKLACNSASSPADAAAFLVRALRADPFCSTAFDMIVDNWLLPTIEIEQLVLSLDFNNNINSAGEVIRNMYLARIPDAAVKLISTEGVPLWLRNYHEAIVLLEANDLDGAIRCSSNALNGTALKQHLACLHLSVLTRTHETATLFRFAHLLSESFPSSAVSFYAAGCYYFSIGSFERAGRLFSRATDLDPLFAESWIAYGHCYARLEEGEQALAAYRRAQNLFPGLHHCDLFLGIQYARQHSAQLALACLENAQRGSRSSSNNNNENNSQLIPFSSGNDDENNNSMNNNNTHHHHHHHQDDANNIRNSNNNHQYQQIQNNNNLPPTSSYDALLLNETAVLYFRSKQYAASLQLLMRARDALPNKERPADHEVCIIFNLASAFRKVSYLDLAASTYLEFIRHRPQAAVGHCAYGFTLHLQGDLDQAISSYRTSLALRRDAFCRDLLERALEERHGSGYFNNNAFGGGNGIDGWLGKNNNNDDGDDNNNNNGTNNNNNNDDDDNDDNDDGAGNASSNRQNRSSQFFDPTNSNNNTSGAAVMMMPMNSATEQYQQQQNLSVQRGFQYHPSPLPTASNHHTNQHLQHQLDSLRNPQATTTATTTAAAAGNNNNNSANVASNNNSNLNFVFDSSLVPPPLVGGGHTGVRGGSHGSHGSGSNSQSQQQQQQHFSVPQSSSSSSSHPRSQQQQQQRVSHQHQQQMHHQQQHVSASPRPTISRALTFQ